MAAGDDARPPFLDWLASEGASHDFVSWVERSGLGWPAIYIACPRADFLLAVAVRAGTPIADLDHVGRVLARRTVDELVDPGLAGALAELESAPSDPELAARLDRAADAAPDPALANGYRALAIVADLPRAPEAIAALPGLAVEVALLSVLDCAMTSVVGALQAELADLVRRELPVDRIPVRWG